MLDFCLKVCYNMDIIKTLFRALSILKYRLVINL